jgi:hypothetical protein
MKKNYLPVLISLFIGPSLFAQSISLDNGKARLVVSLDGGIITELSLGSIDVNVLHDYGHFLCFDRWGPSTKEEKELGIPFHGNASKIRWNLLQDVELQAKPVLLEMSCLLPIVKLGMNRKIYQHPNSPVFRIVEEISNQGDSTKVFNVVQHPTLGAPFLDEMTIVDTRVDSGFSQRGTLPPNAEDVIHWPEAVVEGDSTDLRYLATNHTWNSAVVTYILDEQEEYGWVTAANPSLNLMVGYLWPVSDYPWLNLWLQLKDGNPFARGLEFGSTGLHKDWPTLLEMDTIFGKKLYEEVEVGESVVKSYYIFLSEIPADYQGVASVSLGEDTILVKEYGMDPERNIHLPVSGIETSTELSGDKANAGIWLKQNAPNPFSSETQIEYHLPQDAHVKLEVFNELGQCVKLITDENQVQGYHLVHFHAGDLAEGMYMYRLHTADHQLHKRMFIIH